MVVINCFICRLRQNKGALLGHLNCLLTDLYHCLHWPVRYLLHLLYQLDKTHFHHHWHRSNLFWYFIFSTSHKSTLIVWELEGVNHDGSNLSMFYYGWSLQKKLFAIELGFVGVYFTDQKEKPSIICDRL